MTVASLLGRCFFIAFTVSPGHVEKKPFSTALIHVDGTGLKAAACRNWIASCIVVAWYTELHRCPAPDMPSVVAACIIGTRQRPLRRSRCPARISFPRSLMLTLSLSNSATHPASHIVPMETRLFCASPGIICAGRAFSGSCGKFSSQWLDECSVCPFGSPTAIGGFDCRTSRCGAPGTRYVPDAPVSAIAV